MGQMRSCLAIVSETLFCFLFVWCCWLSRCFFGFVCENQTSIQKTKKNMFATLRARCTMQHTDGGEGRTMDARHRRRRRRRGRRDTPRGNGQLGEGRRCEREYKNMSAHAGAIAFSALVAEFADIGPTDGRPGARAPNHGLQRWLGTVESAERGLRNT